MNRDTIKSLRNDPKWKEFVDWATEKIQELDTITGLQGMTDEQAGQEAKTREKAGHKLAEIFQPFFDYTEKREPSAEEIRRKKEEYGL